MRLLVSILIGATMSLARVSVARANPWELFGLNAPGIATAGVGVAGTRDFTATFYNPAGLGHAASSGWGLGFMASRADLEFDFEKETTIPPLSPDPMNAFSFGLSLRLFGQKDAPSGFAAAALSLPTRSVLSGQAIDPLVPQWSMYQSLPNRLVLAFGLGISPVSWLSLGVGAHFLAGLSGQIAHSLDVIPGRFTQKTVTFEIEPRAAPVVGLEGSPVDGLNVGIVYRGSIASAIDLPILVQITGIADLDVRTNFVVQYMPDMVSFGASYRVLPIDTRLSIEGKLALWSHAPDPSVHSRVKAGGELFQGTGLAGALDTPALGQERNVDLGYRNTLSVHMAAEREFGDVAVRAGYAIRPSPAPVQTSGANYVDGTAHQLGVGATLKALDPWAFFAQPVWVDAAVGALLLPKRVHTKVDGDDPVGTYRAGGSILLVSFGLRYFFGS